MNRESALVWVVLAGVLVAGCTTAPRAAEPRRPPPRPDASVPDPPPARPLPDAGRPAPGRRPAPGAKPGACINTQQCPQGQYCTVEDGACERPPGCGPNDICPMVCWGKCATKGGAAGTRARCGKKLCPAGQVCCNESCGICTPPDGFFTKQLCGEPGGPKAQ